MDLESCLDSSCKLAIPALSHANGGGGFPEFLSSSRFLRKEENFGPILRMAQMNANLVSGFVNTTGHGISSTSRSSMVHEAVDSINNLTLPNSAYLPGNRINTLESCSLPYSFMPFSSNNSMNVVSADKTFFSLYGGKQGRKRQQMENSTASTNLSKSESQTCLETLPIRIKQEPGSPIQMLKKPRIDVNRENIPHQQMIQELWFNGLLDHDPQSTAMINQQRQQDQQQQLIFPSVPQFRGDDMLVPEQQMRYTLQGLGNQVSSAPLLDSSLCSRRVMQCLYHIRNRSPDNNIAYWKKFVSEYYSPDSKKRWCFSSYSDVREQVTGVFCPKAMETWCCDICGSRSGKGLEATFETLPRLLKTKFDSGILDEILFLDLPHAYYKVPSGLLVLEYRKTIQESIYENFRVVHEGTLHVIFRWDLKILSWEFCVQNHEEYLLRSLVAPQVDQLARTAQKYQTNIQGGVPTWVSSEDFQANCNRFVSSASQLASSVDLPLVNGLGYPKRFTRSLQIAEIFNCMKDLMTFSIQRKMGPIESLKNYFRSYETVDHLREKQGIELFASRENQSIGLGHCVNGNNSRMTDNYFVSGSAESTLHSADFNHQLFWHNKSFVSLKRNRQDSYFADQSTMSTCYDFQPLVPRPHSNQPPFNLPTSHSGFSENHHQHLIDKMLQEMVAANRGKNLQYTREKLSNEAARQSWPTDKSVKSNKLHSTGRSNVTAVQMNLGNASRVESISQCNLQGSSGSTIIKAEPFSPVQHR